MRKLKQAFILVLLLACSAMIQAQDGKNETGTELMRSNGRIYVVVAVMLTILMGLIFYLVRLDRKISKLERDNRQ